MSATKSDLLYAVQQGDRGVKIQFVFYVIIWMGPLVVHA